MEITEYKIVSSETARELTVRVNLYIEDGWQPIGGVFTNGIFYQAMVKMDISQSLKLSLDALKDATVESVALRNASGQRIGQTAIKRGL